LKKLTKPRKPSRDKGYRRQTIRLRKILRNGHFVKYPIDYSVALKNEDVVNLWRAVLDQFLKDIIEHHMIKRDYHLYYEARNFIDEQLTGKGQESILALIDPVQAHKDFFKVERLCRGLREKGITL
jgi:hypothetical protein